MPERPEPPPLAAYATAVELMARRQGLDDVQKEATRLRADTVALMGKLLREMPKNTGAKLGAGPGRGRKEKTAVVPNDSRLAPTLPELGLTRDESSQAQKLAVVQEKNPELFEKVREGKVSIKRAVSPPKGKTRSGRAWKCDSAHVGGP